MTCDRFSPGLPVSSTNKTDRHEITEILLKEVLKQHKTNQSYLFFLVLYNFILPFLFGIVQFYLTFSFWYCTILSYLFFLVLYNFILPFLFGIVQFYLTFSFWYCTILSYLFFLVLYNFICFFPIFIRFIFT